jgi:hypothetical protein
VNPGVRPLLALLSVTVDGQELGHHLQGIQGLGSGSPLPPGLHLAYVPHISAYNSYVGSKGEVLQSGSVRSAIHNLEATYMTKRTIAGASYGFGIIAPFTNTRLTGAGLPGPERSGGYSDTFFIPLILGWEQPKADIIARYTIVAPTGSFDPNSDANAGLGFATHMLQFGTSFGFDESRKWNGTFITTWEFHHKKRGVDLLVGPGLTVEYALGRSFANGVSIGAAGHVYQKLAADSGTAIDPEVRGRRDRMLGLGPEFQWDVDPIKTLFFARYQPQFSVRDRLKANVFVVGIALSP